MKEIIRPLTRKQASDLTGLSVRTIDRLIADKTLPAKKYKRAVRIDPDGFRKYQQRASAAIGSTSAVHTQESA